MFCSLCGCEVAEGDRFCKFCGGALVAENASVDASASSVTNDVGRGSKDGPTSPWRAWKNFFRKYFDGSGRASQAEYRRCLNFILLTIGIPGAIAILTFIEIALEADGGGFLPDELHSTLCNVCIACFYVTEIWVAICLCPTYSLVVRRLHDLNYTGWIALVLFSLPVGLILLYALAALPGTSGANRYGPDPASR